MNVKVLTDDRGPLQGVSLDTVIRQAYGPEAVYEPYTDTTEYVGRIVREGVVLDRVINLQQS